VHIGVGRFHRAHQSAYLDRLAEQRISQDWGVVGVGMRTPQTSRALQRQDGLYTLCQPTGDDLSLRVVGHLKRALFAPTQRRAVMAALEHPATKVVSLTVTAPTYLQPAQEPHGVFGLVAEALRRRRLAGTSPFTVMSCDNVLDNGEATRRQVLAAADALPGDLAGWIGGTVAFPSTMVDRITPPIGAELGVRLRTRLSVADECAVVTEPFSQWVVEDDFCNERPPLDEVGVQFVPDARPYRTVKTRLLNGSHCALGYLGSAAGFTTTTEAMADPVMGDFVAHLMRREVAPLLAAPQVDLEAYLCSTIARLSSPTLSDPLERLCARGSVRIPNYVLPSLEDALQRRTPHALLTLVVAGWVAHLRRRPSAPDPTDPAAEMLQTLARHRTSVRALLRQSSVFATLSDNAAWVSDLEAAVRAIELRGARTAMSEALSAGTWGRPQTTTAALKAGTGVEAS
jgi:mannitol-1-phosphate/altronate dehydrogenase